MTKKKKTIIIITAVGLLIVVGIRLSKNKPVEVETARVQTETLQRVNSATGHLKSRQSAELAFSTAGVVSEVNVEVGQKVQPGQVLASLDKVVLFQTLKSVEAGVVKAIADLDTITETYRGSSDEPLTIQTKKSYQELVNQAYAGLEIARKNLSNATLKAPYPGTITSVDVDPGEYVGVTTTITSLSNLEQLYLEVEMDEDDIGEIRINQSAQITFDSYPQIEVSGVVKKIHPQVTLNASSERIVVVEVDVTSSTKIPLTVNLAGNANLILETKENVLSIPQEALVFENGRIFVYKVDDSRARKIEVQIGMETDEWAEAVSGVEGGTVVVVSDTEELKDKVKVKAVSR